MDVQASPHSKSASPGPNHTASSQQTSKNSATNKELNMQRANEEMRLHIAKLKSELEAEKAKYKKLHRDKVAEQKQLRDSFEEEKERALVNAQSKLQQEKNVELQKLKDSLHKERDAEIRQMLKSRDEEIRQIKVQFSQDKDDSIKAALELQRQAIGKQSDNILNSARPVSGNSTLVVKLQREIKSLKENSKSIQEKYEEKCRECTEQEQGLKILKDKHEKEISDAKANMPSETLGKELAEQLKRADKALESKLWEIKQQASTVQQLRQDKQILEQQLQDVSARGESQLVQQNELIASLQKENEKLSADVKDLSCKVEDNQSQREIIESTQEENAKLVQKVSSLERELTEVTKEQCETLNKLQQQNDNLQQRLALSLQAEKHMDEQMNIAQNLKEENEALRKKVFELQNQNADIEEQAIVIEKLKNQMEELEIKLKTESPRVQDENANMHNVDSKLVKTEGSDGVGFRIEEAVIGPVSAHKDAVITEVRKQGDGSPCPHPERRGYEDHEKERQLQKRVSDLTNQVSRLEKKVNLLKQENETLKKRAEEQKSSDEKIKKLKKRNAELAGIARRLEEKAKQLQQESAKRAQTPSPGTQEASQVKRTFAKQRAKDLAEHAQALLGKDKEIETLRQKCQELTARLRSTHSDQNAQRKDSYSEREEFETIIKQAALEKLRLEKQLSQIPEGIGELELRRKIDELEKSNKELSSQLERLHATSEKAKELESQLSDRQKSCESLQEQLEKSSSRVKLLERECESEAERSGQLEAHCARLQAQVGQLQQATSQAEELKQRLADVQTSYDASQVEAAALRGKIAGIQAELERLERVAQEKERLQNEHQATLEHLHQQQHSYDMLAQAKRAEEEEHQGALTDLQAKLQELEQKYKLQAIKHDELTLEMDDLRRKAMAATSPTSSASRTLPATGSAFSPTSPPTASPNANANNLAADDLVSYENHGSPSPPRHTPLLASHRSSAFQNLSCLEESYLHLPHGDDNGINDSYLQTESPITFLQPQEDLNVPPEMTRDESLLVQQKQDNLPCNRQLDFGGCVSSQDIVKDLEYDLELTCRQGLFYQRSLSATELGSHKTPDVSDLLLSDAAIVESIPILDSTHKEDELTSIADQIKALSLDSEEEEEEYLEKQAVETCSGVDFKDGDIGIVESEIAARLANNDSKLKKEGVGEPDSFYKKTPFQVFVAKYSYDPTKFSPNENPEAELTLNAGDYIFVYGAMDEDGFYEGELMDGSHGLLPSNFVERVPDEELEQFYANLATSQREESAVSSIQADLMELREGEEDADISVGIDLGTHGALQDLSTVDDNFTDSLLSFDLDLINKREVPFPVSLQLDRQLTNSIVISWDPPTDTSGPPIQSYHVYVDNEFKTSVRSQERTKALLEGIDTSKTHRVCVRTVTEDGQSRDPQCTMLVGKDVTHAPSGLRVSGVTGSEALLAWLPANSNLHHAICVNGGDARWLSPGVYRYKITGLTHATEQEVTVRAHNPLLSSDTNQKATIRFKTNMEVRPDPPLDVQVEVGPKEGTLLVTWLPVTLRASGTSNGAPVEGYRIYVDDKLISQITGANDDHLILDTKELNSFQEPHVLFLRTLAAGTGLESPDSNMVPLTSGQIQQEIKQSLAAAAAKLANPPKTPDVSKQPNHNNKGGGTGEGEKKPSAMTNGIAGLDVVADISAELSDIAEVDEDEEVHKMKAGTHATPRVAVSPTAFHHNVPSIGDSPVTERPNVRSSPSPHNGLASPYQNQAIVQPRVIGPQGGVVESRRSPTQIGFQPIREGGNGAVDLGRKSPAKQLVSPKGKTESKDPYNIMQVPQIEITKDSSGSVSASGPDNFSDDDAQSSTSGAMSSQPSPVSPVRQFYDGPGSSRFKPPDNTAVGYHTGQDQKDLRPSSGKHSQQAGARDSNVAKNYYGSGRLSPDHNKRGKHGGVSPAPKSTTRDYFDNGFQSPQNAELSLRSDPSYQELLDNNAIVPNKIRDDIPDSDLIDYEDDGGDSLIESVELEYDDSRVRIFIALFNYDPTSMSPNPDASDEELPFKEGQLIKIYGDKDADGFYMGESGGRRGLVPCNMVSEVQVDDPDIAAQLLRESNRSASQASRSASAALRSATTTPASRVTTPRAQGGTTPRHSKSGRSPLHEGMREGSPGALQRLSGGRRMKALYDYNPTELSPNVDAEEELPFLEGDIVTVYGEMDEDGFFYGELKGKRGLVPSNFLEELPKSATTPRGSSGAREPRSTSRSRTPQGSDLHRGEATHHDRMRGDVRSDERTVMPLNGKSSGKHERRVHDGHAPQYRDSPRGRDSGDRTHRDNVHDRVGRERGHGDRRSTSSGGGQEKGPDRGGGAYHERGRPPAQAQPLDKASARDSHQTTSPPTFTGKSSSHSHGQTPAAHGDRGRVKTPSPLTTASERSPSKGRQSPSSDKADQYPKVDLTPIQSPGTPPDLPIAQHNSPVQTALRLSPVRSLSFDDDGDAGTKERKKGFFRRRNPFKKHGK